MLHKKQTVLNFSPKLNLISYAEKGFKTSILRYMAVIFSIPLFFVLTHNVIAKEAKNTPVSDIRIIVDISGSMKKTDPNNLRRSAIRLLAGLIPAGSRAGIWNFGKQVNMTVKIGTVNDAWRELARKESKKINSVGLYTDIENALRKVSFDWKEADPNYKRNIILLTDGHVDVSKNDKLDYASRKRILKEILPRFEKAKVRIHAIALSDDVDEILLSTLSAYTDGLYKKVSNADDLQKIFLQMLEQSAELDTLPIKDNRFNVDAGINDMTLLVFNKDKSHPTTIVTPGKRTWNKNTRLEQLKWFSDDGFDLITIKKPQHGRWKIMAPADENNRVVVATNLKLKLNRLPSYLMLGDMLKINVYLEEDGKPLTDQRLLSKFKFSLKRITEDSIERKYSMTASEGDGFNYNVQLPPVFKEGVNELIIQAKSPTVEREVRHQFKVYATPAEIKISKKQGAYTVKITPYDNLLRPESVKINIELADKTKHELVQHDKDWLLNIDEQHHETRLSITLNAIRADGKEISVSFSKMLVVSDGSKGLKIPVKKHEVKKETPHKTEEKKETPAKDKSNTEEVIDIKEKENEINWTLIIISIVIGNLLLVIVLIGGFIYIKRRKAKLVESLNDEINDDGIKGKPNEVKKDKKEEENKESKSSE